MEFKIRCCFAKAKILKKKISNLHSQALELKQYVLADSEKLLKCFNEMASRMQQTNRRDEEAKSELLEFFERADSMNMNDFDLPVSQALSTFLSCRHELSKIKEEAFQKIDECSLFFSNNHLQSDSNEEIYGKYSLQSPSNVN